MTQHKVKPEISGGSLDSGERTLRMSYGEMEPRNELVERAASLKELLAKNAAQTEKDRRVAEENIQAIADAGLFKITVPQRYGGYEVDIRTKLDVSAKLAEACGSTAWVVTLTNVSNWFASLFPQQTQDEVFGENPDARVTGVIKPSAESRRADGGLVVSGKWYYSTGCLHADWAWVGVPIVDEAGDKVDGGLALIPMSELDIEDTWYAAGMKGSGSNALIAEEVFVPDHRIMSMSGALAGEYPTERKEEALYRSAFVPVAVLVLVGPQLGLGRAALEYVIEKASQRDIAYTTYRSQPDSTAFQMQVAEAARKIDTAHLHAYRAAADIDDAAARGEHPDQLTLARIGSDTSEAAIQIKEAIDTLMTAHGAGSFAGFSPLQRIWRDSNQAARHAAVMPPVNQEVYGKALLGVEEIITALV